MSKGIHLVPEKVRAIEEMQPLKSLKKLRGLHGRLSYIRRFIENLSGRCHHFSKLNKKGVSFVWNQSCRDTFEEIERYLPNSLVLAAPISRRPFLLYVRAMDHFLGTFLA